MLTAIILPPAARSSQSFTVLTIDAREDVGICKTFYVPKHLKHKHINTVKYAIFDFLAGKNDITNRFYMYSSSMDEKQDTALEIYKSSDGAFDITIASVKDLWQFSSGAHQPPPPSERNSTLENVGSDKILLTGNTVTKTADKVKIDLGGAAKGYAVDCANAILGEYNAEYALIDFGGNIGVVGRNPSHRCGEWSVGLQKPFGKSGEYTKIIEISDKSVVTSGTYQRYFKWNGEIYHHIIDPKSGYPSKSGISGVSIICGSALLADCLSTAYLVMGKDGGDRLIQMYGATAEVE